ncbi:hypothetical protein KZP23_07675 [Echinicola marina]|nr:hypothetical protein KZP23_07675 [Echinicola marina]
MRFKEKDDERPTEWPVTSNQTGSINGINIPVVCEVTWALPDDNWTWTIIKSNDLAYNQLPNQNFK